MIVETRYRLREWGLWATGGTPSLSSMFGIMNGFGGSPCLDPPAHIEEVDLIVRQADHLDKSILIVCYTMGGSFREKALALEVTRYYLRKRLERAEWYVNSRLDGVVA